MRAAAISFIFMCGAALAFGQNPSFKTVKIGGQLWMAENLNTEAAGGSCYNYSREYCNRYGKLYSWAAAMRACPQMRTGTGSWPISVAKTRLELHWSRNMTAALALYWAECLIRTDSISSTSAGHTGHHLPKAKPMPGTITSTTKTGSLPKHISAKATASPSAASKTSKRAAFCHFHDTENGLIEEKQGLPMYHEGCRCRL